MDEWRVAKNGTLLGAFVWTASCLLFAYYLDVNIDSLWRRAEEEKFVQSTSLVRQRVDRSFSSNQVGSEVDLPLLERELGLELAWIGEVDSLDPKKEPGDISRPMLGEVRWSQEPDGRWRLQTFWGHSNQRLRMHRLVSPLRGVRTQFGLGMAFLWLLGLSLLYGWRWYHRREIKLLESPILRWCKAVQQGSKPLRSVPVVEPHSARPKVWKELDKTLAVLVDELQKSNASNEQLAYILDGMSEGVVAIDRQFRWVYGNRSARQLLEITAVNSFGRPLIELIRQPRVMDLIADTWEAGIAQPPILHDSELEIGSLSKRFLRLRSARLPDNDGGVSIIMTISDETRLKQLENLRREFTANVSHELKTPLAAIHAYAETLLMGALEDASNNRRFVEKIAEQSARLEALIFDLLKLASIHDSPPLKQSRVHLASIFRQSVDCYSAIAQAKRIQLRLSNLSDEVFASCDREAIATILNNLIGNAIRYSSEGSSVDVKGWLSMVGSDRVELLLEVKDEGIGIPLEEQERIFERFYRVDKARNSDVGGTGLGLAIVKNLVTAMKGTIELQSQVDQGSTFLIRLPIELQE